MNKKGVSVLLMLFEITAAVLVVYIMASIATALGEGESVFRINLAKDTTLLVDTLISAPGEAIIYYKYEKASEYIISSQANSILVYKEETDSPAKRVKRQFVSFKDFGIDKKIDPKNREDLNPAERKMIHFKKIGPVIDFGVGPTIFKETTLFSVIDVDTKDENWPDREIVIAPDEELSAIGNAISINLNGLSGKDTSGIKDTYRIEDKVDMAVELKLAEDKKSTATIYIPSDSISIKQNRKLASLVINSLIEEDTEDAITTKNIIISDQHFPARYSNIAIIVEISKDIKEKLDRQITIAIPEAIKEYYT